HEEARRDPRFRGVVDAVFGESARARAEGARPAERAGPRYFNLLLVTVDTLRAGEMGFLGYDKPTTPNLDDLASRSVVFERAYAMASYTGKALAPMMIGKYPSETLRDGSHLDAYFAGNTFLAERLQAAGWLTMGAASLWYFGKPYGLTQGCDVFDLSAVPASGQYTSTTSPQLADAAIKLLDARAASGRFFFWVHFFDPHSEYLPHPGAPSFADPARPRGWRARALYDGEVWFTDRAIGRLLDYVKAQPWGNDTIVVVTADHGESMAEHGFEFRHGRELWESLVRIPLLIHVPGVERHRVPVKRSVVDLVPTLLDLLGVRQPAPGELSGRSLMSDLAARPGQEYEERDVYFDMPEGPYNHLRRGVITGDTPGMKLIDLGHRQYRLFDLARDPDENADLARDATRLLPALGALESMRTRLREIKVRSPRSRSSGTAAVP
ncbi:MAG: sulfatase, partial [Myxococcota bacterium]|nr:sulfatase [Myxococcota bacterium]